MIARVQTNNLDYTLIDGAGSVIAVLQVVLLHRFSTGCESAVSALKMRNQPGGVYVAKREACAGHWHTLAQQNSGAGGAQSKSTARAKGVRYLRPDDFKAVPVRVRSKLNEGQCLIPQDAENAVPHNIVSGEFARQGQQDWAAYCSVHGKSKVMVVWGGPSQCSGSPFDAAPVSDSTVSSDLDDSAGNEPHGSFWTLSAIPHTELLARLKLMRPNGELLKSATHDALARSSLVGGNVVDCHNGHWRELWYAD